MVSSVTRPGNVSLLHNSVSGDVAVKMSFVRDLLCCSDLCVLIMFVFPSTDKAKVSNCRVIVHCLAGISRSATIAIAYIMKTMGLSSDDAYRYTWLLPPTTAELRCQSEKVCTKGFVLPYVDMPQ